MPVSISPEKDALLVTDMQVCFLPGGSLGVASGETVLDIINPLTKMFKVVLASQDWHPQHHISFGEQGGPWPPHCLQMTEDAELHSKLDQSNITLIVRKGYDPDKEQYTVFDKITQLGTMLKARGIERVFICGIATEYCVHDSTLGALRDGFEVYVITDAIKAIEAHPGDEEKALADMKAHGAKLIASKDIGGKKTV